MSERLKAQNLHRPITGIDIELFSLEGLTEMAMKVEPIHLLRNHIFIFTDHWVELKCGP